MTKAFADNFSFGGERVPLDNADFFINILKPYKSINKIFSVDRSDLT
jgi:hypothetical protein